MSERRVLPERGTAMRRMFELLDRVYRTVIYDPKTEKIHVSAGSIGTIEFWPGSDHVYMRITPKIQRATPEELMGAITAIAGALGKI